MEGYLSVDHTAKRGELDEKKLEAAKLKTILEQAKTNHMSVGMAYTARITHTTPAACYAHTTIVTGADSDKAAGATVPDIAAQLVDFSLNGGIDVALGGRARIMPSTVNDPEYGTAGRRKDGRDLT